MVMCFFSALSIHIICWGALHIKQIVRAIVWKERTPKIAKMIQRDSRLRRIRYNTNVATCTYKHNGIVCMLGQKAKHRSKSIPIVLTALFFLVDHLYNVTYNCSGRKERTQIICWHIEILFTTLSIVRWN